MQMTIYTPYMIANKVDDLKQASNPLFEWFKTIFWKVMLTNVICWLVQMTESVWT